jgi:hypothetical protein
VLFSEEEAFSGGAIAIKEAFEILRFDRRAYLETAQLNSAPKPDSVTLSQS